MPYEYNDGLCSGGRHPRLYLAKGDNFVKFDGKNIPGYCAISTEQYNKNGKWSSTTYTLELAPGVRAIEFLSPLHGVWGQDLESWGKVCEKLGLSIEKAQDLVRTEYPTTAQRLDKLEEFALSTEDNEVEVVVISFGSPTNRERREGYWEKPKSGRAADGRTVTVAPGEDNV